ncbi:MAG: response regulator [Deltaproteobacteria bacterium]|nr:response regulator [Deltaproteobacteria bacterium]
MNNPFVLLVDDEVAFVDTIKKRLVKRDLNVISAHSGADALESIKQNRNLDVVILDVKMPGMDGIDTLKEIKKDYPLVEVIMLTAHATVETAIEGMKRGAFDYLMKPCEIDQLVFKVSEATAKKRSHEEKIREARIKELASRHG